MIIKSLSVSSTNIGSPNLLNAFKLQFTFRSCKAVPLVGTLVKGPLRCLTGTNSQPYVYILVKSIECLHPAESYVTTGLGSSQPCLWCCYSQWSCKSKLNVQVSHSPNRCWVRELFHRLPVPRSHTIVGLYSMIE